MPGMNGSSVCGNDVTVKAAHTSHIADLIKTIETLNVFPNLFHHIESTSLSLAIAMRKAGISSLRSSSEPKRLNFFRNRERS